MDFSHFESDLAEFARRRSTVTAVEILLVITFAYIAASLFWTIGAGPANAGAELSAAAGTRGDTQPAASYDILSSYDPFHRESVSGAGPDVAAEAPPETALDIKLFGTRLADGAGEGSAIIRLQNYHHAVLAVGDEVEPGITLSEIHPSYVILSRNGQRETLYLDPENQHAQSPNRTASASAIGTGQSGSQASAATGSLLRNIQFVRKLDDAGEPYGFSVRIPDDVEIPSTIDLQSGDVLRAVNGTSASDLGSMSRLAQTLQASQSVTLLIDRDGEERTVRLGTP